MLKTVKKLRTENLSLKIKLRNIEQTQQNAKKQNEELTTVVKSLQEEQFSYSNLMIHAEIYTCQLSRLRRESHACGLKTSISRRLTLASQFLTPG